MEKDAKQGKGAHGGRGRAPLCHSLGLNQERGADIEKEEAEENEAKRRGLELKGGGKPGSLNCF